MFCTAPGVCNLFPIHSFIDWGIEHVDMSRSRIFCEKLEGSVIPVESQLGAFAGWGLNILRYMRGRSGTVLPPMIQKERNFPDKKQDLLHIASGQCKHRDTLRIL